MLKRWGCFVARPNGAVIWEGPSRIDGSPIVAIVTGLTGKASANRKTGDMAQVWILRADMSPLDAIRRDADRAICGDCPLRGTQSEGKRQGRACYVNIGQAPQSVWEKYARGGYPRMDASLVAPMLKGRTIRLGAYGDPALVPLAVLSALVAHAVRWTGYTHQWRTVNKGYARLLMASADSVEDRRKARGKGYRSFYVVPKGTDLRAIPNVMECANTRARNPLQCSDCGACAGTRMGASPRAVDVAIVAHGTGARYVSA
jgi:hypothetical protein